MNTPLYSTLSLLDTLFYTLLIKGKTKGGYIIVYIALKQVVQDMCGKGCGFASWALPHHTHQPQVTSMLHTVICTTLYYFLNSGV